MTDLPSDLTRLQTLETWLQISLDRVRRQIAATEREATAQRHAAMPPPRPEWEVQLGIGRDGHPIALHVGGCRAAGRRSRPVDRDQALRALVEGVEACMLCRPDTELGLLD
ncbi:hypothetical protein EYS09_22240 [Streptomyces kasugaensis]|uniref:Uncharacterized protein n=1 Tax=Streptomyces kasugaensis TaxID=1946 RepID=A0A4Q9HRC9_STRKA|nr:DUF6233 domain-containing protein [Streptomyces kasugaensis]TBO57533.1 hypothetical protein EYS09_22240 [Streptomyces kasugaensis]